MITKSIVSNVLMQYNIINNKSGNFSLGVLSGLRTCGPMGE